MTLPGALKIWEPRNETRMEFCIIRMSSELGAYGDGMYEMPDIGNASDLMEDISTYDVIEAHDSLTHYEMTADEQDLAEFERVYHTLYLHLINSVHALYTQVFVKYGEQPVTLFDVCDATLSLLEAEADVATCIEPYMRFIVVYDLYLTRYSWRVDARVGPFPIEMLPFIKGWHWTRIKDTILLMNGVLRSHSIVSKAVAIVDDLLYVTDDFSRAAVDSLLGRGMYARLKRIKFSERAAINGCIRRSANYDKYTVDVVHRLLKDYNMLFEE